MSSNHVDIFITDQDEISVDLDGYGQCFKLGGTAKIFMLSSIFTADNFMDKLTKAYEEAKARKEAKDGSEGIKAQRKDGGKEGRGEARKT